MAENPPCPRCGAKTNKRGFEAFATTKPHKKQIYRCKECGHRFTVKEEDSAHVADKSS